MIFDLSKKKRGLFSDNLSELGNSLKETFSQINEEFEDHLTAINENTSEIQANFEYLQRLDLKIEKLSERIDEIQMFLKDAANFKIKEKKEFKKISLNPKEQEIFLILYTLDETHGKATISEIAKRAMIPEDLANEYLLGIIEKGVPIYKRYINNKSTYSIDKDFKQEQAKKNILGIKQKQITSSF